MIELLILWNVAAIRQEAQEDNDFTTGAVAVWIVLQFFIWPISLFVLLWKKAGLAWSWALVTSVVVTTLGLLLGGLDFYYIMGIAGICAAASVVGYIVANSD
jgi:hypothetical protein